MELYKKYRPDALEEMLGNTSVLSSLTALFATGDPPQAYLFSGSTGCGKTTLGRIVARMLGAVGGDFREVDSADFRGIDSIREIRKQSQYQALEGKRKVWLLDECFSPETLVTTCGQGEILIKDIRQGDQVYSFQGRDIVEQVFKNKVFLNRVIRLRLSNGKEIFTTKEHEFFTAAGWVCAGSLTNADLILPLNEIDHIRMESIEVYQRGNNDRYFQGVIGDKERDQGFVEFFDLQMQGDPSYFAGGCPVHNCHKLTNDAQNAILKALEDPPANVAYILCTTDPQKLIPPIRGRCSQFKVSPLNDKDLLRLLRRVVQTEECSLSRDIYQEITKTSEGLPRNALQILEQVLAVPEDERAGVAKHAVQVQAQGIELCRALVKGEPWKRVAGILTGLKEEDPEGLRRMVCGYCQSALLRGGSEGKFGTILEEFIDPFYTTPWPQLTLACFSVVCGRP